MGGVVTEANYEVIFDVVVEIPRYGQQTGFILAIQGTQNVG